MKKLFFIAMIVLGTNLAQAQVQEGDYLRSFRFASEEGIVGKDRLHLFSDNIDHCPARLASPGVVVDLTVDRTTRQLYIKNGDEAVVTLGSPLADNRFFTGLLITFDRTDVSQVFITSTRGGVISEITDFTVN